MDTTLKGASGVIDLTSETRAGLDISGARDLTLFLGDVLPGGAGNPSYCVQGSGLSMVTVVVCGTIGLQDWRSRTDWASIVGLSGINLDGDDITVAFATSGSVQGVKNAVGLSGNRCAVIGSRRAGFDYDDPGAPANPDVFGIFGDAVRIFGDDHLIEDVVYRERIEADTGHHGDFSQFWLDAKRPQFRGITIRGNDIRPGWPADPRLGLSPLCKSNAAVYVGLKAGGQKMLDVSIIDNVIVTEGFNAVHLNAPIIGAIVLGNRAMDPLGRANRAKISIGSATDVLIDGSNHAPKVGANGSAVSLPYAAGAAPAHSPRSRPEIPAIPAGNAPTAGLVAQLTALLSTVTAERDAAVSALASVAADRDTAVAAAAALAIQVDSAEAAAAALSAKIAAAAAALA